jgi:LacI family transcriptional regulator
LKKIGIRDVARAAGVSITTVSRALNGYDDVSASTKARIEEVVERLNYAPDTNARSLGGKAENTIALLTSELKETNESGFVYGLIRGLFQQCTESECEFMLLATDVARQKKLSFLQLCKKKNLNGVVATGFRTDDPYYHEILNSDLPCAIIDMEVWGKRKCNVTIDNIEASRKAVKHLLELGHREIVMLNGLKTASVSGQRYGGYVSALLEAGINLQLDYMRYCDFSEKIAYEETKKILREYPRVTALFCASDLMAFGAVRAIEELGMRIPEDISVIGFDDIPIASYISKGLSTIRQDPYLMGSEGGRAVFQMILGKEVDSKIVLPHQLILRHTTGAAGK